MKLSLFSVSYAGLWGQAELDLSAFIRKAAQLGYDSVMLAGKRPHLSPLDADPERLSAVRAVLQDAGIGCDVVAGYTDLSPTAAAEVPYLELLTTKCVHPFEVAAAWKTWMPTPALMSSGCGQPRKAVLDQNSTFVQRARPRTSRRHANNYVFIDGNGRQRCCPTATLRSFS